ncbi:unnamed protein product [Fusarium equiseti]|uniref:Uncharacterized protein n=1 Tax=Fusarium equiseti TaxID=61235 RepID=A0A8J2N674_FUSEQ|nr:unnamed protein product [Fusarium equiseti]
MGDVHELAAGNSGAPVVVALPADAEPLESSLGVEVVGTELEKDVTASVLPVTEVVVLPPKTTLLLSVLVGNSKESVGKGRLGISEVGTLMVGKETAPETDDVKFHPISPLWVVLGDNSESVGRDADDPGPNELGIVPVPILSDTRDVVFQPDTILPFRVDVDVFPERVGKDLVGAGVVGKGNEISVWVRLIVGTEALPVGGGVVPFQLGATELLNVELVTFSEVETVLLGSDWVGNDTLSPEGKEVLFQLGAELVPGVTSAEDDRLGNDNVGKDMKVPLGRLIVGTEPLPLEADVVLFHPGSSLLLVEDPGSVVSGVVGSVILGTDTNVSVGVLAVGIEPLTREIVPFQPEVVLPLERTSELVSAEVVGSDRVGKGVSVPLVILTVGTETLLDDGRVVVFHPGPALGLDDNVELVVIGVVGNGALGNGSPVPVILILGVVKLEFHPVEIDSVGRVTLPEGLDVVFPGIDHGSEPLVVPDRVISGSGVLVLGD